MLVKPQENWSYLHLRCWWEGRAFIHSFILKSTSAFVNHNLIVNRALHTSVATRENLAQVPKEGDTELVSWGYYSTVSDRDMWGQPKWHPKEASLKQNMALLYSGILEKKVLKRLLFSRSFVSNSLRPQGLQHARPPCPSLLPGACSVSCPLSQWCHPSHHLILCCPLLLPPSVFPSIRVFSNESALLTKWPKYWSFSFSISPSNEHSALISFRMDWMDLLAV